jgi:hypothetical protein
LEAARDLGFSAEVTRVDLIVDIILKKWAERLLN